MENKELRDKIKRAFTNAAPNDPDAVLSLYEKKKGNLLVMTENKKKNTWVRRLSAIAAIFALLIVGCLGFLYYNSNYAVGSTVSLDINPSIEIRVNRKDRVLDVIPLNEDGRIVVGEMDFAGSDLDVAVNALVGSMLRNGYLNELSNSILISVDGDNAEKTAQLQEKLSAEISSLLNTDTFSGAVLSQTVTADADLRSLADTYGITVGKAQLVKQIMSASPLYTFESLAGLSINELNLLLESHSGTENSVSSVGTASDKAYIGADAAVTAALNHAGLSSSDISALKTELDFDDGVMVYEVEFLSGGYEYEYDINALTGDVLKSEREHDDGNVRPSTPSGQTTPTTGEYLSAEEAKAIACEHASVPADGIWDYSIDFERDDGWSVYEIEFKYNGYEYDYDIDAITGDVLKNDREYDGSGNPSGEQQGQSGLLSAEEAKQLALNHAGVSADDVLFSQAELDYDDGRTVYEVEFRAGGYEYDYEIDAETGKILKSERERD